MTSFKRTLGILLSFIMFISFNQLKINSLVTVNEDSSIGFEAMRKSMELVWNDEFNSSELDLTKWRLETPYSTAYEQVYTDDLSSGNVRLEDGNLIIETRKETKDAYVIQDSVGKNITTYNQSSGGEKKTFNYTSARLYSNLGDVQGKNSFKYGMIEARIKTPNFKGIFPAFWTTGFDHVNEIYRTWPNTGEIDILESLGTSGKYSSTSIQQSIHYSLSGAHKNSFASYYNNTTDTGNYFHVFGVYYSKNQIMFYVNDSITGIYNLSGAEYDAFRTYSQNLILNVAAGVNSATVADNKIDTNFVQSQMLVDYVRVYQAENDDYSHINLIKAQDTNYSGAIKSTLPQFQKPTVLSGSNFSISTKDKLVIGNYDIYLNTFDTQTCGEFEFKINSIPIDNKINFNSTDKPNQHYVGTVLLNEDSNVVLDFKAIDSSKIANIDSIIILSNSTNKPNVIVNKEDLNSYTFEAEELTIGSIKGTTAISSYTETNFIGKKFLVFNAAVTGALLKDDYIEFILPNIKSGVYKLTTTNRMWTNRSIFDISVNSMVQSSNVDFASSQALTEYKSIDCGILTFNKNGDALLRFTITSNVTTRNSGFYMDNLTLTQISDSKIVNINGTSQKVPTGSIFELPSDSSERFVAYTDSINYYCENEIITVNNDIKLSSVIMDISMSFGAAMRLNENTGIRFYTNIDKSLIAHLKSKGAEVELGTLISPKDLIENNDLNFSTNKFVDVVYNSQNYYEEDGFSGIVGSIVNILENTKDNPENGNTKREFVGRGYCKVTINGKTKIAYAQYNNNDISNNSRSIYFLAIKIKESDEYLGLNDNQKLSVDKFALK